MFPSNGFLGRMVEVLEVEVLRAHVLAISFSDSSSGIRDFKHLVGRKGTLAEPLADPDYFARVFVEDGVLTWPNGYDWDSIALHAAMAANGELARHQAAE